MLQHTRVRHIGNGVKEVKRSEEAFQSLPHQNLIISLIEFSSLERLDSHV